jgi:serine/threonine-protein kinase RsbT
VDVKRGTVSAAEGEVRIPVNSATDVVRARDTGRAIATTLGFSASDVTLIATAVAELARNIVLYAGQGDIILRRIEQGPTPGISVVAVDDGPGIADVARAMREGFSTSGRLGLGLIGVKRIMDEFEVVSEVGAGTCVTIKKWRVVK